MTKYTSLRVLMLPPINWLNARRSYVPGTGPDPTLLDRMLADRGIEVTIIDPYGMPKNPLAHQHNLFSSLDPWRTIRVLLRERHFDLIVSVFEGAACSLILLKNLFRFRTPILIWDIGLTENWRGRLIIQNITVPRVSALMVLGQNQKQYISKQWPNHAPVEVIGHYVDTEFFKPDTKAPGSYIFAVGNDPGRDYATLLTALSGSSVKLIIRTNRALNLDRYPDVNVEVIKNNISYEALRELYARAAIVIIPVHETLNAGGVSSLLEAASMGKPIIVSRSSALQDYIKPNETCIEVAANNPKELRSAIDRLIKEPETRQRLGDNARIFAEAAFSHQRFADSLVAMFRIYRINS